MLSLSVHAAELEGVKLEDRIQVDGQDLQLNGIALRTRYVVIKIYVAGLYLPQKTTSPEAAIDGHGAKRISLTMVRDASAEQFVESIDSGLQANNSEAQLAEVKPQVDALYEKIRGVKEAKKGMAIALEWQPDAGTVMLVNGAARGKPIPGEDFYRALLRIWLGDKPVQDDLKKALLGG